VNYVSSARICALVFGFVGCSGGGREDSEDRVGGDGGADRAVLNAGARKIEHLGSARDAQQLAALCVDNTHFHGVWFEHLASDRSQYPNAGGQRSSPGPQRRRGSRPHRLLFNGDNGIAEVY
jgi:hypothetical protein